MSPNDPTTRARHPRGPCTHSPAGSWNDPACTCYLYPPVAPPVHYLSRSQLAERIGVKPDTLNRYQLPSPDAIIGAGTAAERPGWLEATVDAWNASRPGQGRRRGD